MFESYLIQSRLTQILDLMYRERRLMLSGAFDELEAITARRAAAMEALATVADASWTRHSTLIRCIAAGAERNRLMMEACLKGARAADKRLKEISSSQTQLGVYTHSGKRLAAPASGSAQDKRF